VNYLHHTVIFVVQIKRGPTKNVYSNTELSVPVHSGPSYVAVAITPFKVKVKVTDFGNNRKLMRLSISD